MKPNYSCSHCEELFWDYQQLCEHLDIEFPDPSESSLLREDKTGKTDYTYLTELKPIIDRICQRFTEGEAKYARLNWRNASDPLTYKKSAMRHMFQYMNGETDEDHGVAAIINLLILLDLEG